MVARLSITSVLVVCLLATVQCGPLRGPYGPIARDDGQDPHQLRHGVTVLDKDVRDALLFVNRTAKRLPNGQVRARVQMQNLHRGETLWSKIRFAFYDADNVIIDQTEWQSVAFPSQEVVALSGISLRGDVMRYNVQFKDLRSKSGDIMTPAGKILEHGLWRESILPE